MPFITDRLHDTAPAAQAVQTPPAQSQSHATKSQPLRSRFAFDPDEIKTLLLHHIAGQRKVIESLYQQLKVIKADLVDNDRPLYVALYIGDTGVGKTEIVRLLAKAIHGDCNQFCRIDMNTLSQSHYSAAITGAPPGYVGSKEGNSLFDADKIAGTASRPGIVLFDEIEKASPDVARSLMNILDTGHLRLASGNHQLDFCNSLIFMTSNIGSRTWASAQRRAGKMGFLRRFIFQSPFQPNRDTVIHDALHAHFDPEFLNRIDRIALFEPLSTEHLDILIALETAAANQRLRRKSVAIELDDSAVAFIRQYGFDPLFGARSIKRRYRELVIIPLAEAMITNPPYPEAASTYHATENGERLTFTLLPINDATSTDTHQPLEPKSTF